MTFRQEHYGRFGPRRDDKASGDDILLQEIMDVLVEVYDAGAAGGSGPLSVCNHALRTVSDRIERRVAIEVANVLATNAAAFQKAAGLPELVTLAGSVVVGARTIPIREVLPTLPYDEKKPTAIQAVFRLLASRPRDVVRRSEMVEVAAKIGRTEVTADAARRRLTAAGLLGGRLGRYHLTEEGRNVAASIEEPNDRNDRADGSSSSGAHRGIVDVRE